MHNNIFYKKLNWLHADGALSLFIHYALVVELCLPHKQVIDPHAFYNKPVKRCAKSCRSFVSSAQPSVHTLLPQTPAAQTAPRGDAAKSLN